MPDLGKILHGVNLELSDIHRASPRQHLGRTEPGYKLDTSHKGSGHLDCKINDARSHEGRISCREKGTMVMVQEDQAREPWSLCVGLYTVDEGFKAPP